MEFFSSEIAATLQYFSFPFEVVGLALAATEVRFPGTANRINEQMLEMEETLASTDLVGVSKTFFRSRIVWLAMSVLVLAGAVLILFGLSLGIDQADLAVSLVMGLVGLSVLIPFCYFLVRIFCRLYSFINNWVPGRTVGTLGIIIAGIGVLGEAYQFTTQLVA